MAKDDKLIRKLERKLKKLQALERRLVRLLKGIINDEIVDDIKSQMFAKDYSIRIIDNVELRNVRIEGTKLKYEIRNELLVGEGFDIAVGREEGIREHDIFGFPLAFEGKTIIGTPTTIFTYKVHHPGLEGSHIIRDTVLTRSVRVQDRYENEVRTQIKSF